MKGCRIIQLLAYIPHHETCCTGLVSSIAKQTSCGWLPRECDTVANVVSRLGQRRGRWPSLDTTLARRVTNHPSHLTRLTCQNWLQSCFPLRLHFDPDRHQLPDRRDQIVPASHLPVMVTNPVTASGFATKKYNNTPHPQVWLCVYTRWSEWKSRGKDLKFKMNPEQRRAAVQSGSRSFIPLFRDPVLSDNGITEWYACLSTCSLRRHKYRPGETENRRNKISPDATKIDVY